MKNMGKLALAAAGLAVAVFAALGMLSPVSAVADEEAPSTDGIMIGLGEAAPRSDGGTEFDVIRWGRGRCRGDARARRAGIRRRRGIGTTGVAAARAKVVRAAFARGLV